MIKRKMNMRLSVFIFCVFALCSKTEAQYIGNYNPNLLPVSPNAAALGKYGEIPVGISSGIPNISIPIYDVSIGSIGLPLSITYNASGIRVEEIASSVGLGWSPNFGGVISRQMHGGPDEGGIVRGLGDPYVNGYMNNPKTISYYENLYKYSPNDPELTNLFKAVANNQYDAEPDVFYYNFCGYSGKFVYNQNANKFISIPDAPYSIKYENGSWIITTGDGAEYSFEAIEVNDCAQECSTPNFSESNPVKTSWYLTKIVNPLKSETINLTYTSRTLTYYTLGNNIERQQLYQSSGGPGLPNTMLKMACLTKNTITKQVLKQITAKNLLIEFVEDNLQRQDLTGDYSLKYILIKDGNNKMYKKYELNYAYFQNDPDMGSYHHPTQEYYKRLKLLNVKEWDKASTEAKVHSFEYDETVMAGRLSFAQDIWGYCNGKNNTSLVPAQALSPDLYYSQPNSILNVVVNTINLQGGNRSVNPQFTQCNILKKIVYPTGGFTEFVFENNQFSTASGDPGLGLIDPPLKAEDHFLFDTKQEAYQLQDQYVLDFKVNVPPCTYNGNMGGTFVAATVSPQCGRDIRPDCVVFKIKGTNNSCDILFTQNATNVYLPNGHYQMIADLVDFKREAYFDDNVHVAADFSFYCQYMVVDDSQLSADTKYSGGLRIKEMISYNSVSEPIQKKLYKYQLANDTTLSSGSMLNVPRFSDLETVYITNGPTTFIQYWSRSANSYYPLLNTNGSSTAYSRVEEINWSREEGGSTVYQFTNDHIEINNAEKFPYPPPFDAAWERGLPTSTEKYQFIQDQLKLVTQETNLYLNKKADLSAPFNNASYPLKGITSRFITHLFTGDPPTALAGIEWMPPVFTFYTVATGSTLKEKEMTKVYDKNNFITQTREFEYNSNNLPVHVTTQNSKNEILETKLKYPNDFSGTIPYTAMVSKNILIPVIEQTTFNNNKELSKAKVNYVLTTGTNFTVPGSIEKSILGKTLDTELTYESYDANGNPVQVKARDGIKIVYLYGYSSQYPVAKITGADYNTAKGKIDQNILDNPSSDQALRNELNKLRSIPGALVTTLTYAPLTGVTSETDPSGKIIYYEYDGFGRLKLMRDQNNAILKRYDYKYTGQ